MKTLFVAVAAAVLFAMQAQATLNLSTRPTKNMDCSDDTCIATDANAVLNVDDLASMLASGDVRVVTDGLFFQDIEILAPVTWASAHALTLQSNDAIFVRSPINVEGTAHLNFDIGGGPIFQQRGAVHFANTASTLTIEGEDYVLVNSVQSLAAAVEANRLGSFALADDYNARPDGTYARDPVPTFFKGTFDGLGNTISNLSIADSQDDYIALFVAISRKATIRNLGLSNVSVAGNNTVTNELVGSLVAYNNGYILNCRATGIVTAANSGTAGGLFGANRGTVSRAWANVQVTASEGGNAGGLIANSDKGGVYDSYSLGAVNGGDFGYAGGLSGRNGGRVRTSYTTSHITSGQGTTIGGAFGNSRPRSKNVYWDKDTGGTDTGVGNGGEDGVTGLTTAQMQAALPQGFDPSIWGQDPKINNGLPYLATNPPSK